MSRTILFTLGISGLLTVGPALGAGFTETEANDTIGTANPVVFSTPATVSATLNAGNLDHFSLSATSGQLISLGTFGGVSSPDTILGLYRPNGTLAFVNDDGGPSLNSALSFVADANGTWTAVVSGFPDGTTWPDPTTVFDGNHNQSGNYLLAGATTLAQTGSGSNLTIGTADTVPSSALSLGATVIEGSLGVNQEHYYVLNLIAGQNLGVTVLDGLNGASNADSILGIFRPGGSLFQTDDDGGQNTLSALEFTADETGTWFIGMTGFGNGNFDGSPHSNAFGYQLLIATELTEAAVPVPGMLALFGLSLAGLAVVRRRAQQ